jgi:cytoskeleton protein RodZ
MSKLGQILKSERESRELLLHEIGMSLKISPKVLQAIEEGDRENLPAKTFLRGFIKSYAQYLRLDTTHILELFQEEYGSPLISSDTNGNDGSSPKESSPLRIDTPLRTPQTDMMPTSTTIKALPIIGALILLMLISFVVKMMDKYQKESKIEKVEVPYSAVAISSPESASEVSGENGLSTPAGSASTADANTSFPATSTTAHISTTTLLTTTTTSSSAVTTLKPTTTTTTLKPTTTTLKPTTTTTTLKPTTTTLKPTTTTTTLKPTTTTLKPTTTTTTLKPTTTTLKPTTTTAVVVPAGSAENPVEVIIEALNNIEVRFVLDSGSSEVISLAPDQVHTFRGKASLQLEVSDGGAVNVIVNGRDRGVPGSIGKPIKLKYP